jgi:hypothetical protein
VEYTQLVLARSVRSNSGNDGKDFNCSAVLSKAHGNATLVVLVVVTTSRTETSVVFQLEQDIVMQVPSTATAANDFETRRTVTSPD